MAEQERAVPWPAILLLLTVVGGYVGLRGPLRSSRPFVSPGYEAPSLGDETVAARLWQDPFKAAFEHRLRHGTSGDEGDRVEEEHRLGTLKAGIEAERKALEERAREDGDESGERPVEPRILILPVMVSGAPYAEDVERRLGSRYAVISGLNAAGYNPVDATHIGFVDIVFGETGERPLAFSAPFEWFRLDPLREEFARGSSLPGSVLVLWLTDEFCSRGPLRSLETLFTELGLYEGATRDLKKHLRVTVLGPGGSTALAAMVTEVTEKLREEEPVEAETAAAVKMQQIHADSRQRAAKYLKRMRVEKFERGQRREDSAGPEPRSALPSAPPAPPAPEAKPALDRPVSLFSPRATAALYWSYSTGALDWEEAAASTESEASLSWKERERSLLDLTRSHFSRIGMVFERTVLTDDEVLGALIDELGRRGVDVLSGEHRIVLISESDTFYGRALPGTFAAIVRDRRRAAGLDKRGWSEWITLFSYLRGIDGLYPGAEVARPTETEDGGGKEARLNRPEGSAQFDYIRRLERRILRSKAEGKPIKAICVLGSDVYDKLLILQALRRRFPDTIFATTDLDARLFHPGELDWTRNLIVASSFGLALRDEKQRDIPPFRSTYQTALFYTCLTALGLARPEDIQGDGPRIFEIGRNGPCDLTPDQGTNAVQPPRAQEGFSRQLAALCFASLGIPSLVALWALIVVGRRNRPETTSFHPRPYRLAVIVAWLACLLVTVIFACLITGFQGGEGEPLSVTDGISIWPTEALRLATGFLSFFFIVLALAELKISDRRLTSDFGLRRDDDHHAVEGEVDAVSLWNDHLRDCHPRRLLRQGVLAMLAFLLLGILLLGLLGFPFKPFRGELSFWVDLAVLLLSLAPMMTLAFVVSGVAWSSRKFIEKLSSPEVRWPDATRAGLGGAKNGQDDEDDSLGEWLTIRMIGERSAAVGRLILYPFVALFVAVLSRSRYFDNWNWPVGLIVVVGLAFLIALYLVSSLRFAARKARLGLLGGLQDKLVAVMNRAQHPESSEGLASKAESIRHVIEEVRSTQRGAFAPLSRNPALVALLFPFGGMGVAVFIERLVAMMS